MTFMQRAIGPFAAAVMVLGPAAAPALAGGVVVIGAAKDNTLYEPDPDFPDDIRSNGEGEYFFAGRTARGLIRRGLLSFDVAGAVPSGATITSVEVTLHMSRTLRPNQTLALHALLADWGEGASDAKEQEGEGAPAAPGDATWHHRFFDTDLWATDGGDFRPTASALAVIGDVGFYTWGSTEELVADAQAWLDDPGQSFGWMLVGDESEEFTAMRFDTRQNADPGFRPALRIEYLPAPGAWALMAVALGAPRRRRRS